jgi:hypothetical protein
MASGSSSTRRPNACEGAGAARPLRTFSGLSCSSVKRLVLLVLAGLVSVAALPALPAAEAATRRATDTGASVRFTLDNRVLTVRVLRGAPRRVRRHLYGHRIQATCGTAFPFTRGVRVRRARVWPSGRRRVRFRFGRNISRRAKWCLLERSGTDVAFVTFTG